MKLTVKKPFSWAHRGVTVEHFEAGQTIETEDQDLIDVSTKEGWTSKGRVLKLETAATDTTQPAADAAGDTTDTTAADTGADAGGSATE